jgi:hypothetical protein
MGIWVCARTPIGATPTLAQTVSIPLASSDAISVAIRFDDRSSAIVTANACGREIDYAQHRREQRDGNFDNQGEGLLDLVIAKSEWLIRHAIDHAACKTEISVPWRPTPELPTPNDFVRASLESPTNCAGFEAAPFDGNLRIAFTVDQACLKRLINEAVRAMKKNGHLGTTSPVPIPCLWGSTNGEWDSNAQGTRSDHVYDRGGRHQSQ